jgi:hypothetical protein
MKFIIPKNRVSNLMENLLKEDRDYMLPQNHPMIKVIRGSFGREPFIFNTSYAAPFAEDDSYVDVKIVYSIPEINLWKKDDMYEGTIYILVEKIILSLGGYSYQVYGYHDIPTWIWDDLQDHLTDNINDWNLPVEVDFNLEIKKRNT